MDRLASRSLTDVLERVQPAIAAGSVNILSVEAIRDRSGDKWPRKREQVEAFVERTFNRISQPGDLMVCLNDAEFVTVQPSVSRTTALSVSATILKETLAFFLGAAAREDLRLFQVTSFVGGALGVQPLDSGAAFDGDFEIPAPDPASDGDASSRPDAKSFAPTCEDIFWEVTRRVRLNSPPDIALNLAITTEPTWNVGARVVASFLLRPSTSVAEGPTAPRMVRAGELSPNMAGEAACSLIEYAVELIGHRGVRVALHVPLSLNAITYSSSRYRLLHTLRDVSPAVRKFLILELTDLEEGLPQSRVTELVSVLAPHCRAVLARAPGETMDVRAWRGCGLSGVTLDCGHLDRGDRAAQSRLASFAGHAAGATMACVAYGLPSRSLMLAAWAAGFTHVGGPVLSASVGGAPENVLRLDAAGLFSVEAATAA
jgi:hypothetical protein